jgi:bifunctional non-homologous end joining protein LigD
VTGRRAKGGRPPDMASATVGGVRIKHADKVWWPDDGIIKLDVARHYAAVAPRMLRGLEDRPLTAERCPDGIGGECFFQKNVEHDSGFNLPTRAIPAQNAEEIVHYVVGGSLKTLLALFNLGCIAVHVMNCRVSSLDRPDWLAFDLDPSTGKFADAVEAAVVLHQILDELQLRSYPKTTGGRGIHVLVPLRLGRSQEQVRAFAHKVCQEMVRRSPNSITLEVSKAERHGRVFADWIRNAYGQTIVAPYSLRCRPGATVSTPLDWAEVTPALDPRSFTIRTIQARLEGGDPWSDFWTARQRLPDDLPVRR